MIQLGKPSKIENFVCINDDDLVKKLHKSGFLPIYRYENDVYFTKNKEILEVVEEWHLQKQ